MSAHTPVPWTAEPEYEGENPTFVHKTGHAIADCNMGYGIEDDANAALIVRAVNRDHHFDALVQAMEGLLPWLEDAETKCLVGDEGCVWAVEHVRDILASVGSPLEPGK